MSIFSRYVFKNLAVAMLFVTVTLTVVIFLTQSLKFLELVIDSGASAGSFWFLSALTLPRFFESILPLSLMASAIFTYHRMIIDSELMAVRSAGFSPIRLASPALVLSALVTVFLLLTTLWAAPASVSRMQEMRQIIKTQISGMIFREGVFNQVGSGLTVYVRERNADGEVRGVMINDSRDENAPSSIILARRGQLVMDGDATKVIVYDGARQQYNAGKGILQSLNFERYTVELPESDPVRQRWSEPDERTIFQLLNPDSANQRDVENLRQFHLEIHRRIISPLLAPSFTLVACCALLLGPFNRRGQGKRIVSAIIIVIAIEGLFLAGFNLSRKTDLGLLLMYASVILPLVFGFLALLDEKEQRQTRGPDEGEAPDENS